MKILLTLIMCSSSQSTCLDPYPWPTLFQNYYDCLQFGYEESQKKLKEIGKAEVNKHGIFIRFTCMQTNEI